MKWWIEGWREKDRTNDKIRQANSAYISVSSIIASNIPSGTVCNSLLVSTTSSRPLKWLNKSSGRLFNLLPSRSLDIV